MTARTLVVLCTILCSCGSDYMGEGFHCVNGTEEECLLVEQAEQAFTDCGYNPPWVRFHFAHEGTEAYKNFPKGWCGYNERCWDDPDAGYDPDVWIKSGCMDTMEAIVHEALHKIYGSSSNMHPPEFWAALDNILNDCWEGGRP